MEASDELLTIAELAIGLAGFSGVVVAFNRRGGLTESDRYFFVTLLSVTLSAVFLAFVPFGFHHAGFASSSIWTGSSGIMLVIAAYMTWSMTRHIPAEIRTKRPLGNAATAFSVVAPILILVMQLTNVFGWPTQAGALFYVFGLMMWLLIAGMNFVYLVLFGTEE